jgi:hypothetical protein
VESKSPKPVNEAAACEECGQFGAMEIAGRQLCPDCVSLAGCGCAGHGGDDMAE